MGDRRDLHRAELTALEHVAEWVRFMEAAQVPPHRKPGMGAGSIGGINAAVRKLGIDRTKQRAIKVASLTDAAKFATREAG